MWATRDVARGELEEEMKMRKGISSHAVSSGDEKRERDRNWNNNNHVHTTVAGGHEQANNG